MALIDGCRQDMLDTLRDVRRAAHLLRLRGVVDLGHLAFDLRLPLRGGARLWAEAVHGAAAHERHARHRDDVTRDRSMSRRKSCGDSAWRERELLEREENDRVRSLISPDRPVRALFRRGQTLLRELAFALVSHPAHGWGVRHGAGQAAPGPARGGPRRPLFQRCRRSSSSARACSALTSFETHTSSPAS